MNLKAVIEVSKGSLNKYEFNKQTNNLELSRVLPIPCPENYGFIPNTLSGDGDPLDIFIISAEPLVHLSLIEFNPIGVLSCEDQGLEDNKIIAVIKNDFYKDYSYLQKIKFYLTNYKKGFVIKDFIPFGAETVEYIDYIKDFIKP